MDTLKKIVRVTALAIMAIFFIVYLVESAGYLMQGAIPEALVAGGIALLAYVSVDGIRKAL